MDLKKFHKFMAEFAPMLMQMKMRERGYEAWGETQRKTIYESLAADLQRYAALEMKAGRERNAVFALKYADHIIKAVIKGTEGADRPGLLIQQRVKEAGVPVPPFEPTVSREEAIEPTQALMEDIEKLYGGISPEQKDVIARGVDLKGSKFMKKIIEDVAKARGAEAERGLQDRKITLEEKKLPIRIKELEGKGEPKKSVLENKLDSKLKERWGIIEKLAKVAVEEGWGTAGEKVPQVLKNRIEQLNKQIHSLKEKTGTDPDERHAKAAEFLKSKGYSKKDLLEDERIMSWITENKLTVWILLEYF